MFSGHLHLHHQRLNYHQNGNRPVQYCQVSDKSIDNDWGVTLLTWGSIISKLNRIVMNAFFYITDCDVCSVDETLPASKNKIEGWERLWTAREMCNRRRRHFPAATSRTMVCGDDDDVERSVAVVVIEYETLPMSRWRWWRWRSINDDVSEKTKAKG